MGRRGAARAGTAAGDGSRRSADVGGGGVKVRGGGRREVGIGGGGRRRKTTSTRRSANHRVERRIGGPVSICASGDEAVQELGWLGSGGLVSGAGFWPNAGRGSSFYIFLLNFLFSFFSNIF